VLALLLALGFAQNALAQTPLPLGLNNNYMVTGDYVVGGWNKSTGLITIPDPMQPNATAVPTGADIVAAFLYWQTVESSGTFAGQKGYFRGYPITGAILGNPNAPVSWSSGGCAGSALGSKTIVAYRADVSSYIPLDANGNVQPNTSYQVSLPDTAKPGQPPFTPGATLVIIYRLLSHTVPLTAVVIYDGSFAPSNSSQTVTQPLLGLYQAGNDQAAPIATKITHIVGNGQSNKLQSVYLNGVNLPSLYPNLPPFPGIYNSSWDNPTWFPNTLGNVVKANDASATTSVVPSSSNKGCVTWGAVILSTTVQDSDHDGQMDTWKQNQGYCDAGANRGLTTQGTCPLGNSDPSWVPLLGAQQRQQDIFIQLDYMCTKVINNANGTTTCDPAGVSYKPDAQAISNLESAFSSNGHNIHVHVLADDNNVILAQTCTDNTAASPPIYCPFPGAAGAGVVGWKVGYSFLKTQPLNYPDETACETRTPQNGAAGSGPVCVRRFQPGQNVSYHEVIFARASATPNWAFLDGSLASVSVTGTTMTLTTANPHGLQADPADTGVANGRVSISNAISKPNLNGTYLVQTVPSAWSFTIQLAASTAAPTSASDPLFSLTSAVLSAASGVSDVGGADSLVSLGLWGVDGQTVPVESGTMMHELGHSLGLTHGGLNPPPDTGGPPYTFEPNCKANYQSVMNYLFQVDLLDGSLDYSNQVILPSINESIASTGASWNPIHPTTKWYVLTKPFGVGSAATSHCDGTPLSQTDQPMYRVQGSAISMAWSANQDTNFDGKVEASLDGYNDWDNLDLRQIGATGNDFWVGGGVRPSGTGGGVRPSGTGGGVRPSGTGGGVRPSGTGGGVGEITIQAASSVVRTPTNPSATLTASSTVLLSWMPPSFGQSQIAAFNIYRSVNGAPFSFYTTDSVTGTPLPLPNPSNYTDTKVSCATVSYFVTTVLSDGRESVPSDTTAPISVPCIFVGFLSPLSAASTARALPTFSGPRNLGNSLPIKWELLDANGNPVGDLSTLKSAQACPTTGATTVPGSSVIPPCVLIYSPVTGGEGSTTFRFSSPNFIINWDTGSLSGLAAGYWTVELQLSDGRMEWTTVQF
jgi:hypothetical protein